MNIRQKMLLGAVALTLIPVAITAAVLWRNISGQTQTAVDVRSREQLTALRDIKGEQITDELNDRLRGLRQLGAQRSTLEALKQFKTAFATAAKESGKTDIAANAAAITTHIETQFAPEFAKGNIGAAPDLSKAVAALDINGAALQTQYLVENPNPQGQKEKLLRAPTDITYNKVHGQFHAGFEQAQKISAYYDIFLIDPETDTVVYSVFKELDFGSKLSGAGIAAGTGLAKAYERAKKAGPTELAEFSDFEPYVPSYNDQAAFVAVPLFDGDKLVGVLAMQYPIDKITETINSNKAWAKIGLGKTGDIFLVGSEDKKMRTNARYLVEGKDQFLTQLGSLGADTKALINKKDTTIGLIKIDSAATQGGAAGQTGVIDFVDYRGIASIGAFAPIKAAGLNWTIVAKIDKAESDELVDSINTSSLATVLTTGLVVVSIAGLLVALFLRRFLAPITKLSDTVKAVAGGELDARSELTQKDEIGELGRSFDALLDERITALQRSAKENDSINNSAISLLQTVFQLSNRDLTARAPVTEDIIGTVASSVNQFSQETADTLTQVQAVAERVRDTSADLQRQSDLVSANSTREQAALAEMALNLNATTEQLVQVATLAETSNVAAAQTSAATQSALSAVQDTVSGMNGLRESISEMEKRFKRLGERSQEISSAVNLINTISERTHVLALNASMQAATAGEAGRGFAVVAEEVQRLSDSSRQATGQIAQLVGNIQAETNETLFTVNRLITEVVKQSDSAQRAGVQMTQTQVTTQQLVGMVQQIAGLSQRQSELAQSLQSSVTQINAGTLETAEAIARQAESSTSLAQVAQKLTETVGQFRLSA